MAVVALALVVAAPTSPAVGDGNEAPGAPWSARMASAGGWHTCALLESGAVKCFGANHQGQLGQGSTASLGDEADEMSALRPIDFGGASRVTSLSAGDAHTCAVFDTGVVTCWGLGGHGRLGNGSTAAVGDEPGEMASGSPVDFGGRTATAVSSGDFFGCALFDDGGVTCWGYGSDGRLGNGSTTDVGDTPGEVRGAGAVDLGAGRTATAISAGGGHTCALLDTGAVKCWGRGDDGELGIGSTADIGDRPGEVAASPDVNLGAGRTATAISAGGRHTCALLDDGSVKCWGSNVWGQLGQGHTSDLGDGPGEMASLMPVDLGAGRRATSIGAGRQHTCAALDDGTVKCWGEGYRGQLGQGNHEELGDQPGEMGDELPPIDLGPGRVSVAVTAGLEHSCAVFDDGAMTCWGANFDGSLGQDSSRPIGDDAGEVGALSPIRLGSPVGVRVTSDRYHVRVGGTIEYHVEVTNNSATPLSGLTISDDPAAPACRRAVPDLAVGASHVVDCSYTTSALDFPAHDHTATVTGDQIAPVTSNRLRVIVGTMRRAVDVAAGGFHTCALLDNGRVRCWGNGGVLGLANHRPLGDEPGEMEALPDVAVTVGHRVAGLEAGDYHTCALIDNGNVRCWGYGTFGQLGLGNRATVGDTPGEVAALPPVNLGARATQLALGDRHTCALLDDGKVKCWGRGAGGRLGRGNVENLGDEPGEMAALRPVFLGRGRTALAVSAGGRHTCALLDDHSVKCWGMNELGQLGQDTTRNLGDQPGEMAALRPVHLGAGRTARSISAGEFHTCAVLDDGRIKCWGAGNHGRLGYGDRASRGGAPGDMGRLRAVDLGDGHTARAVAAGHAHTCALFDDRSIKCWGYGGSGALGQGTDDWLGDQPGEVPGMPPVDLGGDRQVRALDVGYLHSCALLVNRTIRCFGQGEQGQLGQDDPLNRGDDPGEVAALRAIFLGVHR